MEIVTVGCFNDMNVAAYQFAAACVASKECPTFQTHAAAVMAKLEGFNTWEQVVDRFDKLRVSDEPVEVLFALEDRVLDARDAAGLEQAVVDHANKLWDLHDDWSSNWNNARGVDARNRYMSACFQ